MNRTQRLAHYAAMSTRALVQDCEELDLDVMDTTDREGLTNTLLKHFECDQEEDEEPELREPMFADESEDIANGLHEPDSDIFEAAYYGD